MDVKAQHQNGSINVNNNSSSASLSSADSNSSSNIASSVGSNSSTLSNNTGPSETGASNNSSSSKQQVNKCNLIINYLPQSVKEADFNQLFAKIGPLKSCRLMFDRQTGYSFGYGFVEYTNEEDAKKAIDTLNGYQIEHKRLKVSLARPNCDETKNTNLYVRNIPMSYDEQQLQDLFGQCGEVIQARILRDQNTSFSRRIGFVIMATKQMAQQAIQKLDNTMPPEVGGGTASEPIYVKYADEDGKNKRGGMSGGGHHHHHHNNHGVGHHHNHHHNQYQHRGNNPNSFNQFQNSFQNASFMMNNQQQQHQQQNTMSLANLSNSLANLGKMKNQRSNAHQNHRYNPILNANGGAANTIGMGNGNGAGGSGAAGPGINNVSNNSANFSNPWNLNMSNLNQGQPPFSAFNTSGVASGFDSLINNTLAGMNTNYMHHAAAAAHHQNTNFLESSLGVVIDGNKSLYNNNNNNNTSSASPTSTIYVYGIGQQASEADLYSLFANYGRISRVNVIKNSKTGLCKGFGFVVFESPDEANYAVHSMNGFMYNNRPLQVQLHNE